MSELRFETISPSIERFEEPIDRFLEGLDSERRFFVTLSKEMVTRSELLIAAWDGDRIVGMTGITGRIFFHKAWIAVKKEYQSRGVGGFLYMRRHAEARERYHLVLANIHPDNTGSLELNRRIGYRDLGQRFGLRYLAIPYGRRGKAFLLLFKALLPLANIWDRTVGSLFVKESRTTGSTNRVE